MAEKIPGSKAMLLVRFKKIHKSELQGMVNSGKVDKYIIPHDEEADIYYLINLSHQKAYEMVGRTMFGKDIIQEMKNNDCVYGLFENGENTNVGEVIDILIDEKLAAFF